MPSRLVGLQRELPAMTTTRQQLIQAASGRYLHRGAQLLLGLPTQRSSAMMTVTMTPRLLLLLVCHAASCAPLSLLSLPTLVA